MDHLKEIADANVSANDEFNTHTTVNNHDKQDTRYAPGYFPPSIGKQ